MQTDFYPKQNKNSIISLSVFWKMYMITFNNQTLVHLILPMVH